MIFHNRNKNLICIINPMSIPESRVGGVKCDFRKPLTLLCTSFVLYIETSTTMHHCIVSIIQKTKPYILFMWSKSMRTYPRRSTIMPFLFWRLRFFVVFLLSWSGNEDLLHYQWTEMENFGCKSEMPSAKVSDFSKK